MWWKHFEEESWASTIDSAVNESTKMALWRKKFMEVAVRQILAPAVVRGANTDWP